MSRWPGPMPARRRSGMRSTRRRSRTGARRRELRAIAFNRTLTDRAQAYPPNCWRDKEPAMSAAEPEFTGEERASLTEIWDQLYQLYLERANGSRSGPEIEAE